ncbi:MAG TPA: MerR family transcriptional regulator [Candidatus Gastranaerophilales bacterium]|nr:MerR family transcriptional regulator [Candidatus Gastranaerophilales bacterium]
MQVDENLPVYPMGVAARLLDVHPRTLRIYEAEGLICPRRHGGKRFFSQSDLVWIKCLRSLIHEDNISIEGVKRLLEVMPCWKIKDCSAETRKKCLSARKMHKRCWEFTRNTCEKSCRNCETYLEDV